MIQDPTCGYGQEEQTMDIFYSKALLVHTARTVTLAKRQWKPWRGLVIGVKRYDDVIAAEQKAF